ncbi:MAG: hypothetical protein WAL64_07300 [Candidatus Dormiibacterota bacterium]
MTREEDGSLIRELILDSTRKYQTKLALAIAIADYIEHVYNPARRHSSPGYLTRMNSTSYTRPPSTRLLCREKWSTERGQTQKLGGEGFEPP